MKTPQQIRNEVEKGCGIFLYEDEFGDKDDLFNHDVNCGTYLVRDNKLVLCPSCLAKLSILTEYDKSIKEMIEELQKKVRRMLIDNSKCDCTEWTTRYGDISDVCFWEFKKELLSKIGDVQQTKEKRKDE